MLKKKRSISPLRISSSKPLKIDPSKRSTTIEKAKNYVKKSIECEKYKRLYENSQLKLSQLENSQSKKKESN